MGFWRKKKLTMIHKETIKYYLIPVVIFVIVILIILIVPMRNKKIDEKISITPPVILLPTREVIPTSIPVTTPAISEAPLSGLSPTLIPPRFTGVDASQTFPPEMILLSEQKTDLRRKTPLEFPFGTISFDYENDQFSVSLKGPQDQSQSVFNDWLKQTYPAIPVDQFAFQ